MVHVHLSRGFLVLGIGSTPAQQPHPSNQRRPDMGGFHIKRVQPGTPAGRLYCTQVASCLPELPHIEERGQALTGLLDTPSNSFSAYVLAQLVGDILLFLAIETLTTSDSQGRADAQEAVIAALSARRSILESAGAGDWKPVVARFAQRHLGVSGVDERWLEAVSTALLGNWVDALGTPPGDDGTLHHLRREARTVHRQLMPLWQRKSGPGRVWMLDYRLPSGETLHEVVTGSYRIEDEALAWSPERSDACAVIDRLKEEERQVAQAFAVGGGSWAEAAATVGLPPQVGERVMRKLRRLGLEYRRRRPLAGVA
ncbi:hypothetical protein Slala05_79960 [Streptomyces lavendulae subsp. lavendulae]|nr:hypothetical protein Slala05_79960 [Streptomyces lavendulae subsp. lavendulae]